MTAEKESGNKKGVPVSDTIEQRVRKLQQRVTELEPAADAAMRIRSGMIGCCEVFERLGLQPVEVAQVLGYLQWQAAVQAVQQSRPIPETKSSRKESQSWIQKFSKAFSGKS
jgi:hypothetical protein